MNNKTYFLFGGEVCDIYLDEGFDSAVEYIEGGCTYGLYEYDDSINTPQDLLEEYTGYGDWAELSLEEYETLIKL
jgi:hypothetical protein